MQEEMLDICHWVDYVAEHVDDPMFFYHLLGTLTH